MRFPFWPGSSSNDLDNKEIRSGIEVSIHPKYFHAGCFLAGLALSFKRPTRLFPMPSTFPLSTSSVLRVVSGVTISYTGAHFVHFSLLEMSAYGNSGQFADVPKKLVTSGPYQLSRNPIYAANILFQIGCGILLRADWLILFSLPPAWYYHRYIIPMEEEQLSIIFPRTYKDYCEKVPRWI